MKQMRVLVDRAEHGLTPAEADRLRVGVLAMDTARRSATARLSRCRQYQRRLAAVESLVHRAQARGASTVALWALGRVLGDTRTAAAAKEAS